MTAEQDAPDWTPWGQPRRGERGVETAFHHPLILVRTQAGAALRVVAPGDVFAAAGAVEWSPAPWAQRGRRQWRSPPGLGPGAVFRGDGDRLFMLSDAVCEQVFEGENFGPRGLAAWTDALNRRLDYFDARDIVYRHLVVPDSHAICPEMIAGAPKLSPNRPLLQVLRAISDRARASVVYPLDALISGRARHDTSHPHDVHLTGYGYFLCYRALMATLPGVDPAGLVREEQLTVRTAFIAGDLARSIGDPGRRVDMYEPPAVKHRLALKGTSYKPNQVDVFETDAANLPRLVMFRTSNSSHMFPFLLRHFSRIAAVGTTHVLHDLVESEKPDVVISEMPERYFAHADYGESETDRGGPPRDRPDEFEARTGEKLPLPRGGSGGEPT